jgi:hypothetical protein
MCSVEQEGDDQAEQDQESIGRAGNLGYEQSSFHRYTLSLIPVRGAPLSLHGVLQWWRIL